MMRWSVVLLIPVMGLLLAPRTRAEAEVRLSLHVLQDVNSQPAPSGEPVRWVIDATSFGQSSQTQAPELTPPAVPAASPLAADLTRARAMPDDEARKQLKRLSKGARGSEAYHVWWQIAARSAHPAERREALRRAMDAIAGQAQTPTLAAYRQETELALLETFAWQGDHDAVLRVAAEVLSGTSAEPARDRALLRAREALEYGASAKTTPVPVRWVVHLARELEMLSTEGRQLRALEVLARHGDESERRRATTLLAHPSAGNAWSELELTDPNGAFRKQVSALLDDCRASVGPFSQDLQLSIRKNAKYPTALSVLPREDAHAACLSRRAPEYLDSVATRAEVRLLVSGADAIELQQETKAFVVAATHADRDSAVSDAQRIAALLHIDFDDDPAAGLRGRRPGGVYLTVEKSSDYSELKPGKFLVVAAHGPQRSPELRTFLRRARRSGVDVTMRHLQVYVGCMH